MSWLDTAFLWIGLAGAMVLIALLATNVLRAQLGAGRSHDLTWLSWAGVAAYLLHNVEEYGLDLHGQTYAFPAAFCTVFGDAGMHEARAAIKSAPCPVPDVVFTAVNVPMFWFAAPLGAWLSRGRPWAGVGIYSIIAVNLVAHLARAVISSGAYNPGLLSAVVLFLPLAGWTLLLSRLFTVRQVAAVIVLGVFAHLVLIAAMLLLVKGVVHDAAPVAALQVLNAAMMLVVPLVGGRWLGTPPGSALARG